MLLHRMKNYLMDVVIDKDSRPDSKYSKERMGFVAGAVWAIDMIDDHCVVTYKNKKRKTKLKSSKRDTLRKNNSD